MTSTETPKRHYALDQDTANKGVTGPFRPWESDHTALVHIFWEAQHRNLVLGPDTDEIASMVMPSRWLAANRAPKEPRVISDLVTLDASRTNVILRDEARTIWVRELDGPGAVWRTVGSSKNYYPGSIELPATVLDEGI